MFNSHRQLANHRWAKHRIRSDVRERIDDISECPVCRVDFTCRGRLIKHLLERRVRSKCRGRSCHDCFLELGWPCIDRDRFSQLEARDAKILAGLRRVGHTNLLADAPAKPTLESILKKRKPPAPVAGLAATPPIKRRRVLC